MSDYDSKQLRHLLIVQDLSGKRIVPLDTATLSIGRAESNSIVLDSPSVSRQHAVLLRIAIPEKNQHIFQVIDGNFQGKTSTNGILVNGKQVSSHNLRHGDLIQFSHQAAAKYYAVSGLINLQQLDVENEAELFENYSENDNSFETVIGSSEEIRGLSEGSIARLASFPELLPNPIIELNFSQEVTYVNPEAILQFPRIQELGGEHPILDQILEKVQHHKQQPFIQEVTFKCKTFEQAVHCIPESDLIRLFLTDTTEKKAVEAAKEEAEARYRHIFENAIEGIFQTTLEGRYLLANPRLARIYGYDSAEELIASITDIEQQLYVNPNRRQKLISLLKIHDEVVNFESQAYCKDGSKIWISENTRVLRDQQGQICGFEGSVIDITQKKQADAEIIRRDLLLEAVAEATTTLLGEIEFEMAINQALAKMGKTARVNRVCIFENHPHPLSQQPAMSLRYEWTDETVVTAMEQPYWYNQCYDTFAVGQWYEQFLQNQPVLGSCQEYPEAVQGILNQGQMQVFLLMPINLHQQLWGYIGFYAKQQRQWSSSEHSVLGMMATSISSALQREATEAQIRHRALHDTLTDLPNRRLFEQTLQQALQESHYPRYQLAVMFLDLDRFKTINDTLGHGIGDRLLQLLAQRLLDCVQAEGLIARWGGDEFVILLPQLSDLEQINQLADRILESVATVFLLDDNELYVTVSIGITLLNSNNREPEILIRQADAALYQAKELGKNQYYYYSDTLEHQLPQLLILDKNLRQAMARDEFTLYYQPKINTLTRKMEGVEALLRWDHPNMGIVSPGLFIPLAEENGLILPLGEWVLRTACTQNKAWQEAGYAPMTVAVNLSPKQFCQPGLVDRVTRILAETGLESCYLELEITESTAIANLDYTRETLENLREHGIGVSIDDFGTGHSSLNRLQTLPLSGLKIDKSFVDGLATDLKVPHIVRAIITLAQNLGLNVVAEGVENQEQLEFLNEVYCNLVQGYYFYRPVPSADIQEILKEMIS
jgi:diguanylate cyclase (GGDEF)-like protein/PAS domain S-box-containing protein